MTVRESVRARRRQRRRRKAIAGAVAVVLVGGGAGTAWAMNRSSAPHYRLATVTHGDVSQVVAADGSLAASRVADASFAVSGTVASVGVAVGDRVSAGQTLATMDKSSLDAAVTSAKTTLATADETLTDDEDGTTTSTSNSTTTGTTGATTATATTKAAVTHDGDTTTAVLLAARSTPSPAGGSSAITAAQAKVTSAAKALASALDGELDTVATQCAATPTTVTSTVVAAAAANGTITGSTGSDTTSVSAGGQSVTPASDGSWTLTGLAPANSYTVTITQQQHVVDAAKCSTAVDEASDASTDVAKALTTFNSAVAALAKAAASTQPTGSGSGTGTGSTKSGSGSSSGSKSAGTKSTGTKSTGTKSTGTKSTGTKSTGTGSTGTGATNSTSGSSATTTVPVTSERLAADVAAVAAAKAALAVANNQLASAALTSPVTGTVASVGITKGASVSAGSSSETIEVVADGPLSVQLSIPLSKISLIKVGQVAQVTVDGRSASLPAKVTYVGLLNSSSSTGSSSTYTVTVQLSAEPAGLYDGMGAQVAVDVGTAENALIIPLSALHTTGTRTTVNLDTGGTSTPTNVTVGIVGASTVQVKTGLKAGQQVVLADLTEATPSSGTTSGTGARLRFGGGTGGFPGGR